LQKFARFAKSDFHFGAKCLKLASLSLKNIVNDFTCFILFDCSNYIGDLYRYLEKQWNALDREVCDYRLVLILSCSFVSGLLVG